MAREDLIKIFENTVWMCDTNQKLMDKIKNSMAYNKVISEKNADDILQNLTHETGKEAEIIVSKKRSFEAASAYRGKHISVLNFASATNPGGGVTKGASAQEECLCRVSTLYKCISASEITEAFHKKHWRALKTGEMDSFYNDDCIQTCNVTVFKSDTAKTVLLPEKDWFDVDVISCAAPNLRRMSQHDKQWKKNVTDQELLDIYKKRINRVLDIARYAKSEVVILGAFGCGAFANPPELVAKAMHASIDEHKYDFETIELAIYCPLRDTSNYEVFIRLLEAIHLKETDTLYVLGDILDRGPHPIQIILKLMEMPNVVCLTGNHELMALECLEFLMQEITEISIEKVDEKMLENLVTWQHNGSKSTIDEFRALSREMQYEVIEFIKDFMIYEELKVNGRDYLLVHGGLGNYYPGKEIEEYSLKELIWDRAEYDIQYFEDTYVVTGHTPTQGIMGNLRPGYVYRENHHIAIDCGCNRSGGRLAAVCLETGQEYYAEKN